MSVNTAHPFLDEGEAPRLLPPVGLQLRGRALKELDWRQLLGGLCLLVGFVVLGVGWWGISGTDRTVDQLSYLFSGGLGGAALIGTGLTLLVGHEHTADRDAIAALDARLAVLEEGLAGEFDTLRDILNSAVAAQETRR
jgi:hypothetical protein